MQQESLFIDEKQHQLHVRRVYTDASGPAVLMLHGTIENGRIFYTKNGKGLACHLANQGFDVYVADFRGKGESKPALNELPAHGQHEMIVHDVPAFIRFVAEQTNKSMHVVCHSWGGVIFHSTLARFPELASHIEKVICFGTKRTIHLKSLQKFWKVDVFWNRLAPLIAKKRGYINAVRLKFGADNETYDFLKQCVEWVKPNAWVDPEDNYDYAMAAATTDWPPVWHITGIKDDLLGHIDDVRAFAKETNANAKVSLLSIARGNQLDYDHINILTAPQANHDHFPKLVSWLNE